ncbi:uncharacterized protein F5891DRAFT_974071 [Suillus fuscotomentosus]|uniref:NACHT domain-containing protein n=1 Tax=Suillus fuscotomentosus TaxID=1912939 RepID=A0AAD4EME5_9AGAM|nr:uncharacterized protein F5891DRAFT_974071 [Suillus fuscotomentosus]KAG1908746.1 hypothetical protein F5891DRAFT_974071 [Suillus fuscotomentosus]
MAEGTWEKLSQVAVLGAEYDSPERQPHPKCLKGTRVDLLEFIHGRLNKREKSQIIWLHGTAGVGKSAVAFTVAERMKSLKMTEETKIETRLAGTFFFSRKHTKRSTTGHFFATLAYQLASNFPSVRNDVNRAVRENPAVLDSSKSLRDQMKALFRQPLWHLQLRLRDCPPPVFVIDALDECKPETIPDLISLLGEALRDPELPMIHILLTSRLEEHIRKAIQTEEMCALVYEIPVHTSGEGISRTISLDGEDVDNDIYVFLQHSFMELQSRHPDFPQPTEDNLTRLANRAGRRFIIASTMMKFVDDGYNDPRERLELMLDLTNKLLPGTEVYELYNRILSTCSNPNRAYQHLSIVAALADPLPISLISKLLGPGQGSDVATVLVQLRSFIDIPVDSSHPINIYHSSIRDYVSDFSNCNLSGLQPVIAPHSQLAYSSFCLMIQDIPERTDLMDALSELRSQDQAMQPLDPRDLQQSLAFIVEPPEPLQVLMGLLWLRGARGSGLRSWLRTLDGRAWLQTQYGEDYLRTQKGEDWLQTLDGGHWLQTHTGDTWLRTERGRGWLQSRPGWLWTQRRRQVTGDPGEDQKREGVAGDTVRGGMASDREQESVDGDREREGVVGDREREGVAGGRERKGVAGDREREGVARDTAWDGMARDKKRDGVAGDTEREGVDKDAEREVVDECTEWEAVAEDTELEGVAEDTELEDVADDIAWEGVAEDTERESVAGGTERKRVAGDIERERVADGTERESVAGDTERESVAGDTERESVAGDTERESVAGGTERKRVAGGTERERVVEDTEQERVAGDIKRESVAGDTERESVAGDTERESVARGTERKRVAGGTERERVVGDTERERVAGDIKRESVAGDTERERALYFASYHLFLMFQGE